MDEQRKVVVETNLDERAGAVLVDGPKGRGVRPRTRHARARFVEARREADPLEPPEIGSIWCPLTVRARLQRMADVFRRVPHTPDTKPQGHRSCMPQPVREIFKDQPGEPMRLRVAQADYAAAMQTLDSFVTLSRLNKIVGWHLANNISDRRLGRYVRRDHKTAAKLKQKLLAFLAGDWNARGWVPEAEDVRMARDLIHRNFD